MSKGVKEPKPLTDNEMNEMRNLKKKVEYLKGQIEEQEDAHSQDEDEDEEVDEVQPKKKNIKA